VSATWGTPLVRTPLKNCGPLRYPIANRKRRKNAAFRSPET
jgi:hypothetical protein